MTQNRPFGTSFEQYPVAAVKFVGDNLAPHHTICHAGLVGGGNIPHPREISLAHRCVLFLDEFLEFGNRVLEVMRQPMEDKVVTISRAKGSLIGAIQKYE